MTDIFVMRNEQAYAAFCGYLSLIYTKSFLTEKLIPKSYEAKLYVNDSMLKPFNNQTESAVDRIKFLNSKMIPTKFGVDLKIERYEEKDVFSIPHNKLQGMTYSVSQAWKMINISSNPNLITCNLPPEKWKKGGPPNTGGRYFDKNDIETYIKPNVYIDYNTPIKDLYNILTNSKVHITYQGGSAWISILMGIPTIVIHNLSDLDINDTYKHLKLKIYGQDVGVINYFDGKTIQHTLHHPSEKHIMLNQLKDIFHE